MNMFKEKIGSRRGQALIECALAMVVFMLMFVGMLKLLSPKSDKELPKSQYEINTKAKAEKIKENLAKEENQGVEAKDGSDRK